MHKNKIILYSIIQIYAMMAVLEGFALVVVYMLCRA